MKGEGSPSQNGATKRTRTPRPLITKQPLFLMSYSGIKFTGRYIVLSIIQSPVYQCRLYGGNWHTVERIELPTRGFGDPCSTPELHRHKRKAKLPYILSYYLKIMFTLSEGLLILIMFTSFTIIYSIIFLRYTIYNLSSREKVSKINKLFF